MTKLTIFTDLDGTLLDHNTYSFQEALPALKRLKANEVPLILTTSKTYAEVMELQAELGISTPCIVENGSCIHKGSDPFFSRLLETDIVFGKSYQDICLFIDQLPKKLRSMIYGFNDMSAQKVAQHTGLPIEKAKLAKTRLASEPFLWSGTGRHLKELHDILRANDLNLLQGGRFYHILSKVDKADALVWMMQRLSVIYPEFRFHSCALGDGPNDIKMIKTAHTGIVIANPHSESMQVKDAITSNLIGPRGWNEAMNNLLDHLGMN